MPVHYEVHVSDHPDEAKIIREQTLEDAQREAEELHGTVITVIDFDD